MTWVTITEKEIEALDTCIRLLPTSAPSNYAIISEIATRAKKMRDEAESHAEEIGLARLKYAESSGDNIEIDDEPMVSVGDHGVFVSAWVWVPNAD